MQFFNKDIRMLYGRSSIGESNRKSLKLSITPVTMDMVNKTIDVGKGKYGSAFIELAIRIVIALVNNGEDLEVVAKELMSVCTSPYLTTNLRRLIRIIELNEQIGH